MDESEASLRSEVVVLRRQVAKLKAHLARQHHRQVTRQSRKLSFQNQLLDAVEHAVVAIDLKGRITYWNHFAETLFGWPAAEVKGCLILDLCPSIVAVPGQEVEILTTLQQGRSWSGQFLLERRNNNPFWALVTCSPLYDEMGNLAGIAGVLIDISAWKQIESDLRRSESQKRALLNAMPDLIFLLSREGVFLDYYAGTPGNLMVPPEQFLNQTIWQVLSPELASVLARHCTLTLQTGEVQTYTYSMIIPSGEVRHFESRTVACNGNQFLVMVQDITARRQAEAAQEQLIGELKVALSQVKRLSGLLPICASCKKIRDDQGYWHQVEVYIGEHVGVDFTTGICPDCKLKLYPREQYPYLYDTSTDEDAA